MRFREFGGYSEYRETNEYKKQTSEDVSREMNEAAKKLEEILASIDLSDLEDDLELEEEKEVNREAIYGIDQEIIRKEEVREIKYDDQKEKNELINNIIIAMINAGYINENSYTTQKEISDARSRLENNSLEELKIILMKYQNIDVREEKMCAGMNR